jgi:hypothetical protein
MAEKLKTVIEQIAELKELHPDLKFPVTVICGDYATHMRLDAAERAFADTTSVAYQLKDEPCSYDTEFDIVAYKWQGVIKVRKSARRIAKLAALFA